MKKFLSFALVIGILFSLIIPVSAESVENASFDESCLANSPFYKYDKFEKTWKITSSYDKDYTDGSYFHIGVLLFTSYVDKGWGPELRFISYDADTDTYEKILSFDALVDDTMFSFSDLEDCNFQTSCGIFGGTVSRAFLNSLGNANEVSFRFGVENKYGTQYHYIIENVSKEKLQDLIEIASVLEEANAWSIDQAPEKSDKSYGASISE